MLSISTSSLFSHSRVKTLLKVIMGVVLFFCCAQLSIPLTPVPISLQTIGALFIGYTFSTKEATASLFSFLLLGAMGLPVFAGYKAGFAVLIGPTGGYLFGFLIAVRFISQFYKNKNSLAHMLFLGAIGLVFIYGLGVLWLSVLFGFHKAIIVGLLPFIWIEPVKLLLLGIVMKSMHFLKQGFCD